MPHKIVFTVDVEPDLHTPTYKGVTEGLTIFEKLCDKYKIKPILFTTADCIRLFPSLFKRLQSKGWEIASHGYSHARFDDLSLKEKEEEITKSIEIFKKNIQAPPKGFRAPQHSIDNATLNLLERYEFEYDSSYTPLNLLQLAFFPKKLALWTRAFFSPLNPYSIRPSLKERPSSAFILPFVSLVLRVFPQKILKYYIKLLSLVYREPMFYCHSWDFINLEGSRINRLFPHTKFIANLEYVMSLSQKI